MKNPENLSDCYKMFGYELTDEPEFLDKEFGITPEIREHIYELYFEAHEPARGTIKKLKNIIKKYPHVPQFKNYLTAIYDSKGDKKKAYECNKLIQEEHPDYLFGKINLAAQYFEQKKYDKIPDVLGEQMEIQALYPDRKVFHVSEVMSFNRLAVIYYTAIGNLEEAESRFRIMEEIDEEHPDTYKALEYLIPERIKASIKRDKEDETLIDSDFNALIACDIIQLKAKELLPLVKTFCDNGLVSTGICGDFKDIEDSTINRPERDYYKYELFNIYDRYTHILNTWAGYHEAEEEEQIDDELNDYDFPASLLEESINSEPKIGRNNPCPCGSGKKYKKCCWSK